MLPQQDLLVGLAQIALTLTGFASLVTVFRKADTGWKPSELSGLRLILEFSMGAAFFAIFPIMLNYLTGTAQGIWQASALIHIVCAVNWIVLIVVRSRKLKQHHSDWVLDRLIAILLAIFLIPILLLQVANVFWFDSFGVYLVHLLYIMFVSGIQFIIFVYNYASEHIQQPDTGNTEKQNTSPGNYLIP